jgi:hypothetical protein
MPPGQDIRPERRCAFAGTGVRNMLKFRSIGFSGSKAGSASRCFVDGLLATFLKK